MGLYTTFNLEYKLVVNEPSIIEEAFTKGGSFHSSLKRGYIVHVKNTPPVVLVKPTGVLKDTPN